MTSTLAMPAIGAGMPQPALGLAAGFKMGTPSLPGVTGPTAPAPAAPGVGATVPGLGMTAGVPLPAAAIMAPGTGFAVAVGCEGCPAGVGFTEVGVGCAAVGVEVVGVGTPVGEAAG
jgi:hypothetical protein